MNISPSNIVEIVASMSKEEKALPFWKSDDPDSLYMRQGSWRELYYVTVMQQHAGTGSGQNNRMYTPKQAEQIRLTQYAAQMQMLKEARAQRNHS